MARTPATVKTQRDAQTEAHGIADAVRELPLRPLSDFVHSGISSTSNPRRGWPRVPFTARIERPPFHRGALRARRAPGRFVFSSFRACFSLPERRIGILQSYMVMGKASPYGPFRTVDHRAYRPYGYRLAEIVDHLGVHVATVSRRLKQAELADVWQGLPP